MQGGEPMILHVSDPQTRDTYRIPAPAFRVGERVRVKAACVGNPAAVVVSIEGPYLRHGAPNHWLYRVRETEGRGLTYPVSAGALRREGGGS